MIRRLAEDIAPAKVNLTLSVGPAQANGRHPLDSLVVFVDVGERVILEHLGANPHGVSCAVWATGRFAGPLTEFLSEGGEASVEAALWAFLDAAGLSGLETAVHLVKEIPLAAGLGGGSADAAAMIRLLHRLLERPSVAWEAALAAATRVGADVPACLLSRPVIMRGEGERLFPAPPLPPMALVLVNPGVACPTGEVYRSFDALGLGAGFAERDFATPADFDALVGALSHRPNDLEPAAIAVQPVIRHALSLVAGAPWVELARLSGSGATVFGLCRSLADAQAAADDILTQEPGWWVRAAAVMA